MFGKRPKIVAGANPAVQQLVNQLMAEPFAESLHLGEATLDQLGRTLEESATDYERDDLPPSLGEIAASFQRCKDIYCQILLDLESMAGSDWDQKTLAEMSQSSTPAKAPLNEEQQVSRSDDTNVESFETTVVTELAALEINLPKHNEEADTPRHFETEPEPSSYSLPDASELIQPPTFDEVEAASTTKEPNVTVSTPITPSLPPIPQTVNRDMGFGQRAKEAQLLSEWLRTIVPKEPSSIDSTQINRIASQLLGNALEIECWERMREGVVKVWEKREGAIKRLMDTKKSPWCLPQGTKDQLQQFEKAIFKKTAATALPYFAMENSLRYLHSISKLDAFFLSLLDAGTLLFFFGQKRELREYQLENHFWTEDGRLAECTEAALRLLRFHNKHKKTLTPWLGADAGDGHTPSQAEDEIESILELFDTIGLRRGR